VRERYCPYCVRFRHDEGFKQIVHPQTGSQRGMCPSCQTMRKRPRSDLVALAARDKLERKKKI